MTSRFGLFDVASVGCLRTSGVGCTQHVAVTGGKKDIFKLSRIYHNLSGGGVVRAGGIGIRILVLVGRLFGGSTDTATVLKRGQFRSPYIACYVQGILASMEG